MVSIPVSASAITSAGYTVAAYLSSVLSIVMLLKEKKVFITAAILTTFNDTIHVGYQYIAGSESVTLRAVGTILVQESTTEFLNSATLISQGLGQILEFLSYPGLWAKTAQTHLLMEAGYSIWQGVAAVYMLLFLYVWFLRKKVQNEDSVDWPEKALVLIILLLGIALVKGPDVLTTLLEQVMSIADTLAQAAWDSPVNNTTPGKTTVDQIINSTSNSTK